MRRNNKIKMVRSRTARELLVLGLLLVAVLAAGCTSSSPDRMIPEAGMEKPKQACISLCQRVKTERDISWSLFI